MGKVGGHCGVTNLDRGALEYIARSFPVKTMIDVGCGPGGMVEIAKEIGLDVIGIDGDSNVRPDILHNFDYGPLDVEPYDLAWSVEFLEHIEEHFLRNVFSVLKKARWVFCTHNQKPGPWHFNCRSNEYWIAVFDMFGFNYDPKVTNDIKIHSTMDREFVSNTGTFFVSRA
jgi:2-polyprenyl-3-methyl-5-hydroxy-6-metoxy-1,4-benzoquinol methylase